MFLLDRGPYGGVTGTLCFGLRMTLSLSFKVDRRLRSFVACNHTTQDGASPKFLIILTFANNELKNLTH